MKRALLAAAVTLAVSAIAPAASAHSDNDYSAWACGGSRSNPQRVVLHSHTIEFEPTHISASCVDRSYGQDPDTVCDWIATLWWNGVITHGSYHCAPIT